MVLCPLRCAPEQRLRVSRAHRAQPPHALVDRQQVPLLPPAPGTPLLCFLLVSLWSLYKAGPCDHSKGTKFTLPVSKFSPGVGGDRGWSGVRENLVHPSCPLHRATEARAAHQLSWAACSPGPRQVSAGTWLSGPRSREVSLRVCCMPRAGEGLCRSF